MPTAVRLYEFPADHSIWAGAPCPRLQPFVAKIHPPAGASDEEVARVRGALLEGGAMIVRVVPRRKASEPLPSVTVEQQVGIRARDARKVVDRVLADLRHPDGADVRVEVEAALSAEGI